MGTTGLTRSLQALCDARLDTADSAACASLLADLRLLRGFLDATEARLTSRLQVLHDTTGAPAPADVHTRCGGVSAAEARRTERRAVTISAAPSFAVALADGAISAAHVDALANATAKLDDDLRRRVFDLEADLLADATRLSSERFGRAVRDLARRLERDAGLGRDRRQRHDTFLSRHLIARTGMIEGRFAFHPELANQIFGPVEREVAAMIADGDRAGDPEFVDRVVNRNRLAAEALGRLVAGGHQQRRPVEAEITVIVDAHTLDSGELHDRSVCETGDGAALPPASVRRLMCNGRVVPIIVDTQGSVLNAGRTIRHANRTQRRAHPSDVPRLRVRRLRHRVRPLRDPPSAPLGTGRRHRSGQSPPAVFQAPPRRPRSSMGARISIQATGRSRFGNPTAPCSSPAHPMYRPTAEQPGTGDDPQRDARRPDSSNIRPISTGLVCVRPHLDNRARWAPRWRRFDRSWWPGVASPP